MLALAALAEGREVLVSRGELIEIGDGFRIPDVLARSGARLVEVGTTNRTRVADYERALGPETAVILRVHQSNFRVVGFTEQPALAELAAVAARAGLPLVDDLGSGALSAIGDESTPAASLAAGADIVCFSGDKLLGGPQAGILAGRADLIERLRRHPLQRALRADKLTLAALEGTLAACPRSRAGARRGARAADARRARCDGAGSAPNASPASSAARSRRPSPASAAEHCRSRSSRALPARSRRRCSIALRAGEPPVVGIVRDGRLLLDVRALADGEIDEVAAAVAARARVALVALTVGTAGHIDHGKTWLVRALTGKDTDRLPGGAAARDLDRPRLRAARAARRAPALADRRARATSASSARWSPVRPGSTSSCS